MLEIKESSISGKGLFTTHKIKKGEWITQYDQQSSPYLSHEEVLQLKTENKDTHVIGILNYCLYVNNIDVKVDNRNLASFANESLLKSKRNCAIVKKWRRSDLIPEVWLKATRDIEPNKEIITYYGYGYNRKHYKSSLQ